MTGLHEAAQQALEALKYFRDTAICSANTDAANEVIPDLEAALAQQAEPVLQGPVRIKPGSYTLGATWVGGGGGSGGVGAPPQQAEPVLQTCNCRWDGEVQVQQCTLHEAHIDAIHEWAERAKVAERKLAQQAEPHRDLRAALQAPGCERLREWVEIGPVQRAALETFAAALAQQAEPVCKCDLRTRLVGDGCEVCNPKLAAELARQAEPEELTMERLRDALVASRIIPPAAVEDPEGYDDGVTLFRIEALHRRLTA